MEIQLQDKQQWNMSELGKQVYMSIPKKSMTKYLTSVSAETKPAIIHIKFSSHKGVKKYIFNEFQSSSIDRFQFFKYRNSFFNVELSRPGLRGWCG